MTYKWSWERTDAGRPGMSGDIAKLFRHEEPKAPGVFALDPLRSSATFSVVSLPGCGVRRSA